jgi:hypothetical protein
MPLIQRRVNLKDFDDHNIQIYMMEYRIFHKVLYSFKLIIPLLVATLALGSRPRQGGWKVVGQEGDTGVTSHAPGSERV